MNKYKYESINQLDENRRGREASINFDDLFYDDIQKQT